MDSSILNTTQKDIVSKDIQKRALKLSVIAVILFLGALIVNYFRTPLFGLAQGYAPDNITFNGLFFIPVTLCATLMASIALRRVVKNWKIFSRTGEKYLCLFLTTPILLLVALRLLLLFLM